jgi:GTP-binding protein YchF
MPLTAGIVGLPNVGKSTLFNAITKKHILAANYPFATIEPNVGMVTVPDKRLDFLNDLYKPKSLVPTTFEFTDIAGLVKGASHGEGLGNKFLSHIREVDAVVEVVRCFDDANITHVEGGTNPIRDIEIIDVEFIFCDLEVINNRLGKIEKKAISTKDKDAIKEVQLLKKIKEALENNVPARKLEYTKDEEKILKAYNLLTKKPVIYVANIKEEDINKDNDYVKKVREYAKKDNAEVIVLCAKIEEELSGFEDEEKNAFLNDLGIEESGLDKLIKASYHLLGLQTYFTAGPKEVRAWTFKKSMKAPECAGIIHSDFEKGFIRAEVISFSDMEKYKGEKECKEAGKLRSEGKDYQMQDGDICLFRFNN